MNKGSGSGEEGGGSKEAGRGGVTKWFWNLVIILWRYLIATLFTFSFHSSPDGTGDVLNDIGNMLANLTDELDAMLEQEVIMKN